MSSRARRTAGPWLNVRVVLFVCAGAAAALTYGGATSAIAARDDLRDASARLEPARQAAERLDLVGLRQALLAARGPATAAQKRMHSVSLRILGVVPLIGRSVRSAQAVADAGAGGVDAALANVRALDRLTGASNAGVAMDRWDPEMWGKVATDVARAQRLAREALARLRSAPHGVGVLGAVGAADAKLARELVRLSDATDDLAAGARLGARMFGPGPKRSFLMVVQNLAEARATGGLIGGYALLETEGGRMHLRSVASNVTLTPLPYESSVPMPEWYRTRYDRFVSRAYWSNSTMEPDFRVTGTVLAGLYERGHGTPVDGVLSVDPIALQELLRVTGPITGSDGARMDAASFAGFFMNGAYIRYPADGQNGDRKQLFERLASDVWRAALRHRDARAMVEALARAAQTRHLMLWFADPEAERDLERLGIAGDFRAAGSCVGVVTQNASANKVDYYLRRSIAIEGETHAKDIAWRMHLTLQNLAPSRGLPRYILGPDAALPSLPAGTNRTYLSVFLAPGVSPGRLAVAGGAVKKQTLERIPGATVVSGFLDIPSRATRVVELSWTEPRRDGPLTLSVLRQPTVAPDALTVTMAGADGVVLRCGAGARTQGNRCAWSAELDRPLQFRADVRRSWWRSLLG